MFQIVLWTSKFDINKKYISFDIRSNKASDLNLKLKNCKYPKIKSSVDGLKCHIITKIFSIIKIKVRIKIKGNSNSLKTYKNV